MIWCFHYSFQVLLALFPKFWLLSSGCEENPLKAVGNVTNVEKYRFTCHHLCCQCYIQHHFSHLMTQSLLHSALAAHLMLSPANVVSVPHVVWWDLVPLMDADTVLACRIWYRQQCAGSVSHVWRTLLHTPLTYSITHTHTHTHTHTRARAHTHTHSESRWAFFKHY